MPSRSTADPVARPVLALTVFGLMVFGLMTAGACRTRAPLPPATAGPPPPATGGVADAQGAGAGAAGTAGATGAKQKPRNAEECKACRGQWGLHGLSDREWCNCRTSDGGKICRDGNACEGACIAASDNPEQELVDSGPPPRGFFVGRCAEFVASFGCFRFIDRGATSRGPKPLTEPPDLVCAD